jgi:large subunit ribosomal protein L23
MKSRLYSIIKSPIVTEKSNNVLANTNTYTFSVVRDANKLEIKAAVEEAFNVKVKSVNTLNMQGKVKRTGQRIGRRQDWKRHILLYNQVKLFHLVKVMLNRSKEDGNR